MTLQEESQTTMSAPQTSQTHARSDKEITLDHADIMVYNSSLNTIMNKYDLLTNILLLGNLYIYKSISSLLESENNVLCIL